MGQFVTGVQRPMNCPARRTQAYATGPASRKKPRRRHPAKSCPARAPERIAELKDIDTFVVEHDADTDTLDKLAAAGCEVLRADRPA